MFGVQVQSLIGKLKSHKLHGVVEQKKKKKTKHIPVIDMN